MTFELGPEKAFRGGKDRRQQAWGIVRNSVQPEYGYHIEGNGGRKAGQVRTFKNIIHPVNISSVSAMCHVLGYMYFYS